jgi:two-component system sensor histidine kinase EvgS
MYKDSGASGPRVLIVDDHQVSRQFMAAALRHIAGVVKQAGTASEARTLAWSWLPDIILMDVRLGHANGFDVARQILHRWPHATRRPRVIMLSAQPRQGGQRRINLASTDGFLAKPVNVTELLHAIAPSAKAASGCADEQSLSRLQDLFRDELATRLDPLEACLTTLDLAGARAILHQLIASSGLCRQRRLERDLRALHDACGKQPKAACLARPYFSLLVNARRYLQPPCVAQQD